jgi:oxygen-independent coproporphyrinogen-3 oxidase
VAETVKLARRSGIDNISVDLLYDVPGQTVASWRNTLDGVVRHDVAHVSAYALSLDDPDAEGLTGPTGDHLPLRPGARRWRGRTRNEQSEDRAAEMYSSGEEMLSQAGFAWYEVSNWARPGRESRHNLAYWQGRPWQAVGPGAHAFDGARTRRWNAARLDGYLAALLPTDGRPPTVPPGGQEMTDEQTATSEEAILRLRTRGGLPPELAAHFGEILRWARTNGLVEATAGGGVQLNLRGRLLSNELFVRLLPEVTKMVA